MVKKKPRMVSLWKRDLLLKKAIESNKVLCSWIDHQILIYGRAKLFGFTIVPKIPLHIRKSPFYNIGLGDLIERNLEILCSGNTEGLISMQHVSSGGKTAFEEGFISEMTITGERCE